MVWFEWRDDDNGDRWPNEGEHTRVALFPPDDLTASTGTYTLLLDDRSGLNGERGGFSLTGSDEAGHLLEDGGSAERNKHLFIYEIGPTRLPSSLRCLPLRRRGPLGLAPRYALQRQHRPARAKRTQRFVHRRVPSRL